MITIEVNGKTFGDFKKSEAFISMETVSGSFNFTATAKAGVPFPIKQGSECLIFVDDVQIIKGFVEKVGTKYDDSSHDIVISGRDRIADLVDGTVGNLKDIKTPITLETMCRLVLDGMGLNDLQVINETGTQAIFSDEEKVSAEVGVKGFEFLESYARKRQILMTSDGESNLILTRNSEKKLKTKILNVIGGDDNNVLSSAGNSDSSALFNKYIVRSQLNPSATGFEGFDSTVSDISGIAFDDSVRKSRVLEINAEQSMDAQACQKRAEWEANVRRARSTSASYTIALHSANGELWIPNRIVDVLDQFNNISAQMLIKDVKYTSDLEGGSMTAMSLVPPDAFKIEASKPGPQKKNDDIFAGFIEEE